MYLERLCGSLGSSLATRLLFSLYFIFNIHLTNTGFGQSSLQLLVALNHADVLLFLGGISSSIIQFWSNSFILVEACRGHGPGGRAGQHLAAYRAVDQVELIPHSLLERKHRLVVIPRMESKEKELTYRLIHTQDQARGLHCGLDSIDLDQAGLPNKGQHIVTDALVVEVDTSPGVTLAVLHTQAVQDICSVEASVITQLAGNNLQSLGECLDDGLLLVRDVTVGKPVHVARQLHFSSTTASNDGCVTQSTLDDHDSIVQTTFHLRNKLLSATTQHESAGLSARAVGEQVETLSTNLALLERATGTQVALLDVSAGRLGCGTGSLANTVQVVRGHTASTEDVSVREVPAN